MKEKRQNFIAREINDGLDELEKSHRLNRFESMLKFSRVISGSLSLKDIIKKAKGHTKKLLECEHVCIYLKEKESHSLSMIDQSGHKHVLEINENSFVGSSAYLGATLKVDRGVSDIRFAREVAPIKKLRPKTMLVLPLVLNGELLGVIQATNSLNKNFNEQDIQFGESVAAQLTPVIQNAFLYEELHTQFIQVVEALADTITKKDTYTGGHTKRVAHFAMKIGAKLNLTWEEMNDLKLSAVLHDIGKIGIEDAILKKRAPLTDEEFKIMRDHPRLGYEILKNVDSLSAVVDGMRFHHERPDGLGYPYGLKGDEIPVIAMIISVADTFDAMISTRPYRKGLPPMVAYKEILDHRGTQFSEVVVDAFAAWFETTKMYSPNRLDSKKKAS
ncbi:putative signaling protein [Halobacteriovorax marinus SJ]|uniref:Signaling protein n=1 Tax=Halobacteriovorax marinus (strain ATCC BAA-682 / DSM 15412 / SJ) TaxID=862908 RepID=E1X2E0_HALMS|nr:HD domain-containing phosphohydrolase [Halobacteriovorax marinus]CBW26707.1 putative signaling protein [Halobacteriovorax marinus SJ]